MTYPYRVFCVFPQDPQRRTFYVGINAKDLTESSFYGDYVKAPFPEKPDQLWVTRTSVQAFPHLPFVLADEIIPACTPFEPLQVIVVDKNDYPEGCSSQSRYGLSDERCKGWNTLVCLN